MCLTLALCSDFLLQHWLVREHKKVNSLRLIVKVVKYTIRYRKVSLQHRYPVSNKLLSRLDVAKRTFGGPFTSQQVEDVKSFVKILAIASVCTAVGSGIAPVEYASEKFEHHLQNWHQNDGLTACFTKLSMDYSDYLFAISLVLLYEFIIHPLFYRCLPNVSIKSKFLFGIVIFLFRIIALLGLETAVYREHSFNNSTNCIFADINYTDIKSMVNIDLRWLLIPGLIYGLSSILFIHSGIEFIWAQTPYFMTGLVIGMAFAFLGLNTICLLYTSPSPRDATLSRMPSSA